MIRSGILRHLTVGAVALLLLTGCASSGGWQWPWSDNEAEETGAEEAPGVGKETIPARELLASGVSSLEAGAYEEAETHLSWLASRCESGRHGRTALLLLASSALDPRNSEASVDRGARLAARYLTLPGADPRERAVAEVLYLLALDRGGQRPDSAVLAGSEESQQSPRPATRFIDCEAQEQARAAAAPSELPEIPGSTTAAVLSRTRVERDTLRERVSELEAELQRIRDLLSEGVPPDTSDLDRR